MSEPEESAPEPTAFQCPRCGETVEAVPELVARLLACTHCGEFLLIPAIDGSTDVPDEVEEAREEVARNQEEELDGLRMRNVVALRRTAIRSRSYAIVGGVACLIAAVKLALMTYHEASTAGWHARPISFIFFIVLALWAARRCFRRAAYWAHECRPRRVGFCEKCAYDLRASTGKCPECGTPIPADLAPPDFSSLSDGSQHARNLEQIQ